MLNRSTPAREAQILLSLSQLLAHQLRMPVADLDPRRPFLELGADSMVFLEISQIGRAHV